MVSDKVFTCFPYISLCPMRGHFWPKGYNLNKLDRGQLGDYISNVKALGLEVSDKKIGHMLMSPVLP